MFKKRQIRQSVSSRVIQQRSKTDSDEESDQDEHRSNILDNKNEECISSKNNNVTKLKLMLYEDDIDVTSMYRDDKIKKKKRDKRNKNGLDDMMSKKDTTFISDKSPLVPPASTTSTRQRVLDSTHFSESEVTNDKGLHNDQDIEDDRDSADMLKLQASVATLIRKKKEMGSTVHHLTEHFSPDHQEIPLLKDKLGSNYSKHSSMSHKNNSFYLSQDISTDEDEWEMQQIEKGQCRSMFSNLDKKRSPTRNPLDLRHTSYQNSNLIKTDHLLHLKSTTDTDEPQVTSDLPRVTSNLPIVPIKMPLEQLDNCLLTLEHTLNTLCSTQTDIQKEFLQASDSKLQAAQILETFDTIHLEDKLIDFQTMLTLVTNMSDFVAEKQLPMDLAIQALNTLETSYSFIKLKKRQELFSDDLEDCGYTPISNTNNTRDDASDEFGRSTTYHMLMAKAKRRENRKSYDAQKEKKRKEKSLSIRQLNQNPHQQMTLNIGDDMILFKNDTGSISTAGIDGWSSNEEELEDNNIHDSEIISRNHFTKQRIQFTKAVSDIFHDVSDEYMSIGTVLNHFIQILQRYPTVFHETYWNIGIRDIVSLLVTWDLLFWDPFFDLGYWDNNLQEFHPLVSIDFDHLRWYSPILDFVTEVEDSLKHLNQTDTTQHSSTLEENIMSFLIFKVVCPRVMHWIVNCWDPLSLKQTTKICLLIKNIIKYREPLYTLELQNLFQAVTDKFHLIANQLLILPPISSNIHTQRLVSRVVWRAAKLSQCVIQFVGLLSDQFIRNFLWDEILLKRLGDYLQPETRCDLPQSCINAFIIIISSSPRIVSAESDTLVPIPKLLVDFLMSHCPKRQSDTTGNQSSMNCIDIALEQLQLG